MFKRSSLSLEQALQKLRHYCAYQERCHQEVKEKLYSFGLSRQDVETAVATLIEEDQLNEERFAVQFAGGHFRLRQWGKVKIRHELRQRRISEYCLKKALASITEEDYEETLRRLAVRKWESLGGEDDLLTRRRKLQGYLLQKGYEPGHVTAAVASATAAPGSEGE